MPAAGSPSRPPLGAPPSWLPLAEVAEDGEPGPGPGREGPIPGEHWPAIETIDYVSKLIVLIVLLLALPWLVSKLLTAPHEVTGHAAGLGMGAASMGA